MSVKEYVQREVEQLSEAELLKVAEYLAFLKLRSRLPDPALYDELEMAALYQEFAEEDRQLAESGMTDYANTLATEDTR